MKNVWKELPKPIFILAPMEGVTDTVFRRIINYCGRPGLYFTEFTNVDGLFSKGKQKVEHRLLFAPSEKPIIAQIWGMNRQNYTKAAEMLEKMGFDGIDINMGCPEKKVVKRGACAGLIHNPTLAGQIIDAVRKGSKLPLSVKTRIGIKEIETEPWISFLLKQNLDALIVHARTVKEMTSVPAHWDEMEKIVKLRDKIAPETLIIGNGDIITKEQGLKLIKQYGMDGVMIGRGIFQDPFLFNQELRLDELSLRDRMKLLLYHSRLFEKEWGQSKNFEILRKFYKIYTHGLPNASKLREKLMTAKNLAEVKTVLAMHKDRGLQPAVTQTVAGQ